jgi:Fe-S cluster biogenesis protein NfuA/nitrite reductase/ring-hydroxylating ferredoxin subunit
MAHGESPEHSSDLGATGERIDALLTASATGGVVARERAEELVRLVTDLYGTGLERVMEILYEAGRLDDDLLAALAGDELVSGLLIVHGLHPYGVEQRVEEALEGVRPYLGSHGGDVELLEISESGTVRLRLLGSCDGCPSSSVTLKLAVEGAIESAAPEVVSIEVDAPTTGSDSGSAGPALIPVGSLMSRLHEDAPSGAWHAVPELGSLGAGEVLTTRVGDTGVFACRIGSELYAYVDRCARCESSLAGAALARRLGGATGDALLRCPSCQVHYDVRKAGSCVDLPELHLDPLPLLDEGGTISVAVLAPEVA